MKVKRKCEMGRSEGEELAKMNRKRVEEQKKGVTDGAERRQEIGKSYKPKKGTLGMPKRGRRRRVRMEEAWGLWVWGGSGWS
ncbi:hypothetical protein Tco_1125312 [Tanacetum coccineum]|uniref:Small EDRK-rich factor-like N-terminal domain-containing protein n=1 Tax=Tanacetum coccineum TaxID=301880 RepID=A0ABQ5JBH8_9ASTR